ncbi:MAG: hypothetical protein II905_00405, partial [Muribaculaceae bacterium]|nr:hypothetical protein [Muribaculaceae bacterium]
MPDFKMEISENLEKVLTNANVLASVNRTRMVVPEQVLLVALGEREVVAALRQVTTEDFIQEVVQKLRQRTDGMERCPEDEENPTIVMSYQYRLMMRELAQQCVSAAVDVADVPHLMYAIK